MYYRFEARTRQAEYEMRKAGFQSHVEGADRIQTINANEDITTRNRSRSLPIFDLYTLFEVFVPTS